MSHVTGPWTDIQGHLERIYSEVVARPGAVVCELGVRSGESTRALLAGCEAVDGRLWSVDVNDPQQLPDCVLKSERWTFLRAGDLSSEALLFVPKTLDVLFVDTSHTFEHTWLEIQSYVPRLRPGGVALFHDTELSGDWPDMPQPQPEFPVAAALDMYCEATGREWRNVPGYYGLGVLRGDSGGS
jgi:predicted O-methyltransferase YrrM